MTPEDALDKCIELINSGKTREESLNNFPEHRQELEPLLAIAQELETFPQPEFSADRIMHSMFRQIAQQIHKKKRSKLVFFPRILLKFAATATILLLLGWSATAASANALPGDVLYPLKRFTEKTRILLALNHHDEAELRITFSERRLAEALKTHQQGKGIDDALLRQMLGEAKQALDEALKATPENRARLLSRLGYLAAHQKNVIEAVKKKATPEEQKQIVPVSRMCGEHVESMGKMLRAVNMATPCCPGCWGSGRDVRSTPESSTVPKTRKASKGCSCPSCN